jgi:hypothetical protein
MDEQVHRAGRRRMTWGLACAAVCALGLGYRREARAAKSTKAELSYQDHASNGKRCADCKFFTAPSSDASTGTCAVVEGAVDRDGWCMAFSPRSV